MQRLAFVVSLLRLLFVIRSMMVVQLVLSFRFCRTTPAGLPEATQSLQFGLLVRPFGDQAIMLAARRAR